MCMYTWLNGNQVIYIYIYIYVIDIIKFYTTVLILAQVCFPTWQTFTH